MKSKSNRLRVVLLALVLSAFASIGAQAQATYCDPSYANDPCGLGIYIQSFRFGTELVDNASPCTPLPSYKLNPTMSAPVTPGQSYQIFMAGATDVYQNLFCVFADWDQNGKLNDADEVLFKETIQVGTAGVTRTITIPANAVGGPTRLRVRCCNNPLPIDPCALYSYGEAKDYILDVKSYGLESAYPAMNTIWRGNLTYDGSTGQPKPSITLSTSASETYKVDKFRIVAVNAVGLSQNQVVYEVLDPTTFATSITNLPTGSSVTFTATKAQGMATVSAPPLSVTNDGRFICPNVPPGTYQLQVTLTRTVAGGAQFTRNINNNFFITLDRDMTVASIESPLPMNRQRYIRSTGGNNNSIPIRVRFLNVGLETVKRYRATVTIRRASNNQVVSTPMEVIRSTDANGGLPATGLPTGAIDEVLFSPNFISTEADSFTVTACCELLETMQTQYAVDQQQFNDCIPSSSGQPYKFQVWYFTDYESRAFVSPTGTLWAGRPFAPGVLFANNGLSSETVTARLKISQNGTELYSRDIDIEIPTGLTNNTLTQYYPTFIPPSSGQYQMCVEVISTITDEYPVNNTLCTTLTVQDRMSGTYSVGTLTKGLPNFPTIQSAVDALYERGVRGPVTFLLTDSYYSVGNTSRNASGICSPALDLTSMIIGVDATNTITWKPDPTGTGLAKAGVTIQLNSCNGVGVSLGQSLMPSNPKAVQSEFPGVSNANSPGYMTFDGGAQKSLKFMLHTFANRRAVFYVGQRAYNNTIRNCIIEMDPSTPSTPAVGLLANLPGVTIQNNGFTFGPDSTGTGSNFQTYTAGIVQRNIPPANIFGNNREGLDTVIVENNVVYRGNKQNRFIGNEIRGFSFGIVSLGIGTLKQNNRLVRFYNTGTEIRDNMISKVRRAGIFLGYEEGSKVTGNKIFDVGINATGVGGEANGIELGGWRSITHIGYNNIDVEISRNEINNVWSDQVSRGITVVQVQNNLSTVVPPPSDYLQPSSSERIKVVSNMIWGVNRTQSGIHRGGIHLMTDRVGPFVTNINNLLSPSVPSYFTRGDLIANNTILLDNESVTPSNVGVVTGIAIQQANGTIVKNNAIALRTSSYSAGSGLPHTAIFYQGVHPRYAEGLRSDRNAFWLSSGSIGYLWEVDSLSNSLYPTFTRQGGTAYSISAYPDEYQTIRQWRAWTKQDNNSVVGNFTNDYIVTGTAPLQYLRVKTNPSPIGSILSNRGERLSEVVGDLDGEQRGSGGVPYDLGADEFSGLPYVNDVEVTTIVSPGAYRSGRQWPVGTAGFYDAEHIMGGTSYPVVARLRNNGSLSQVVTVIGEWAVENASSTGTDTPVYPNLTGFGAQSIQIAAGETKDITLGTVTPEVLTNLGAGYTTPVWMRAAVDSGMRGHVTPRYRIQARIVTSDERMGNNADNIDARFYIRRSALNMAVSWETKGYWAMNPSLSNATDVENRFFAGGRLNADTLARGMDSLGLFAAYRYRTSIGSDSAVHFDVIDRQGWEPRTIDYTWYRTLIWSPGYWYLSYANRQQIRDYVSGGNISSKKNLIMSSQDVVWQHVGLNPFYDEFFPRYVLRARRGSMAAPNQATYRRTPLSAGYDNKMVTGMAVQRGIGELVKSTGFANGLLTDYPPTPALVSIYVDPFTEGLARPGYKYMSRDAGVGDSLMSVATSGPRANVLYLGTEWRHFGKVGDRTGAERVLRASFDYFDDNDGKVIPVELEDFTAYRSVRGVDIVWSTASEQNSAYFAVERRVSGSEYSEIERVTANGNSSVRREYGVSDADVHTGEVYEYRLRMVDRDGREGLSHSVEVRFDGVSSVSLGTARPNPSSGVSVLNYSVTDGSSVDIRIYDALGREVGLLYSGTGTEGSVSVDGASLDAGMYQVVLRSGSERLVRSLQIIK
ncbi:MAG: T9SS type A sorting domain-containing protein [Bacteroidetes bacterium]|nr:T9SS type A sorting domain-containing protein [Bacteroidota bacterium]